MKKKKILLVLIILLLLPVSVFAQTFTLTIQNQNVSGTEFSFDIYMLRTGSTDIYLGDCDFVVTFNNANFTNPVYTVVQLGDIGSNLNTWYSGLTSIVSSNRAILNISQAPFSNQTQFDGRIQVISNSGNGTLIAKVKITGITNTSGTAGIQWRTATPNNTVISTLANTDPWNATDISGNGTYTNPSDAPLPVELSSFSAYTNANNVNLSWKTATEMNNNGFQVERKVDTKNNSSWTKIGFVEGHGNSNSPKEYTYTDKNLTGGTKFLYRLKQIDNDGKYQYSKEVEVEVIPKEYALYQNYPNPFNPSTNIKFDLPEASRVTLNVYNIIGQHVASLINGNVEAGFHNVTFNGSNLPSGTYIYRLQTSNFVQVKKMVLLK